MTEILACIEAQHFVAGIVLLDDKVVEAADIVKYMKKWKRDKVREYCKSKGWKISIIHQVERRNAYIG